VTKIRATKERLILQNHMHFILQSNSLSKDIQRLKSVTAKKIIKTLNRPCLMYALDAGGVTRKTPLIWGYAKKL
jgi:REP element-mobilizing transposase RayT